MATPEDIPVSSDDVRVLMQRLGISPDETPSHIDGTGAWLLEKWRHTGRFCCINLQSDYSYVWDVSWSYSEGIPLGKHHLDYRVRSSFQDFDHAIYISALAAFGIRMEDLAVRERKSQHKHYDDKKIASLKEQIRNFFPDR